MHLDHLVQAQGLQQILDGRLGCRREWLCRVVYNSSIFCNHHSFDLRLRRYLRHQRWCSRSSSHPFSTVRRNAFLFDDHPKSAVLHDQWWGVSRRVRQLYGWSRGKLDRKGRSLDAAWPPDPGRNYKLVEDQYAEILPEQPERLSDWERIL